MANDQAQENRADGSWFCNLCSLEQPADATYCNMCLYARPLSRQGIPQIFAGYAIHFNGVIPRTIMHPSHAVEWRMAEQHGAVCIAKFDPTTVNLLVYRPGYERSEKCRLCIEKYTHIPPVPVTWMMDSLLQSRQIHPSLYRLTAIPGVANPTVRGTNLPHHQHPYYQIHKNETSIPTSFPPSKSGTKVSTFSGQGISYKDMQMPPGMEGALPPFFDVDPFQYTTVNVYDAAIACAAGKNKGEVDEENDEMEARQDKAGIELITSQQPNNKIDKMLFSGMSFVLSPGMQKQANAIEAMQRCGAKILKCGSNYDEVLRSDATHVIYSHEDKKCDLIIVAAHLIDTDLPGLQLGMANWVEDCLILGEVLPLYGMYAPTPKLMETLSKKYAKMGS